MARLDEHGAFGCVAVAFALWDYVAGHRLGRVAELLRSGHFYAVFDCLVVVSGYVTNLHYVAVEVVVLATFPGGPRLVRWLKSHRYVVAVFVLAGAQNVSECFLELWFSWCFKANVTALVYSL